MRAALFTLAVLCACHAEARAQQAPGALPPTAPTAASIAAPAEPVPVAPTEISRPASVEWTQQRITLSVAGTPLADLLRQISARTGLLVLGTPGREPIFGVYGPGDMDEVLSELFEGLPVNLLIAHQGQVRTLTISARTGGVTPPSPRAATAQFDSDDDDIRRGPVSPHAQTAPVPTAPGPTGLPTPASTGQTTPSQQPPGNNSVLPPSPNGVRTPGEIFQQLQNLRQQNPPPPQ